MSAEAQAQPHALQRVGFAVRKHSRFVNSDLTPHQSLSRAREAAARLGPDQRGSENSASPARQEEK
jgi:hypothetical protein